MLVWSSHSLQIATHVVLPGALCVVGAVTTFDPVLATAAGPKLALPCCSSFTRAAGAAVTRVVVDPERELARMAEPTIAEGAAASLGSHRPTALRLRLNQTLFQSESARITRGVAGAEVLAS